MSRNDFRRNIHAEDGGTVSVRRLTLTTHPDAVYLSNVDRFSDVVTVKLTIDEARELADALYDATNTADLGGAA